MEASFPSYESGEEDYISGQKCWELGLVTESIPWFIRAAELGFPAAFLRLYRMYNNGTFVKNAEKSLYYWELVAKNFTWFQQRAETSSSYQCDMGIVHEFGIGTEKNPKKAAEYYLKAAHTGNALGEYYAFICFTNADYGFDHDDKVAANWVKKSAERGNASAQYELGLCYLNGWGVEENEDEALAWIQKSADYGNDRGLCFLGQRFVKDGQVIFIPIFLGQPEKGIEYLKKSGEQGNATALYVLALCYEDGCHVPEDINRAISLYEAAAERENSSALYRLGLLYQDGDRVTQNWDKAVEYYKIASDLDDADASLNLALCYIHGHGVPSSLSTAVTYLKKAAKCNLGSAQFLLGLCYEDGEGVQASVAEAIKWYRLAASQGIQEAEEKLKELEGSPKTLFFPMILPRTKTIILRG
jgi:TPR repeat protein